MNSKVKRNLRALVLNSLLLSIGFCFGGRIGLGVALTFILLAQII